MKPFILWLINNPIKNWIIAIVYYLLVVLPHEEVGLLTVKIFGKLSRVTYDRIILYLGFLGLFFFLWIILKSLFNKGQKERLNKLKIFYLFATLLFSVISCRILVIINIEMIHFVQYGSLAILVFPLVKNYAASLIWLTILGAIDEGYQYFYLSPDRTNYYDFNDIVMDLIGGAWGLILIWFLTDFVDQKGKQIWLPLFSIISILILVIVYLYTSDLLHTYPPLNNETSSLLLYKVEAPESFWSTVHPQIVYHIIQPLEGVVLTVLLLLFYSFLGKRNTV